MEQAVIPLYPKIVPQKLMTGDVYARLLMRGVDGNLDSMAWHSKILHPPRHYPATSSSYNPKRHHQHPASPPTNMSTTKLWGGRFTGTVPIDPSSSLPAHHAS